MADVAQLVERSVVVRVVAGSIPVVRPILLQFTNLLERLVLRPAVWFYMDKQ